MCRERGRGEVSCCTCILNQRHEDDCICAAKDVRDLLVAFTTGVVEATTVIVGVIVVVCCGPTVRLKSRW